MSDSALMLSTVANISREQRDEYIFKLRQQGYTVRQIAKAVGLSSSGVSAALIRMDGRKVDIDAEYDMYDDDAE